MATQLTTHQVNCLSYAICNTDSRINFSSANKDINGTRTIRALITKQYIAQWESAEGTVTAVTRAGADALIAYYKKLDYTYDAKVIDQTFVDHIALAAEATEQATFDAATTQSVNSFLQQAVANYEVTSANEPIETAKTDPIAKRMLYVTLPDGGYNRRFTHKPYQYALCGFDPADGKWFSYSFHLDQRTGTKALETLRRNQPHWVAAGTDKAVWTNLQLIPVHDTLVAAKQINADREAASQPLVIACTCGECGDCTKVVAYDPAEALDQPVCIKDKLADMLIRAILTNDSYIFTSDPLSRLNDVHGKTRNAAEHKGFTKFVHVGSAGYEYVTFEGLTYAITYTIKHGPAQRINDLNARYIDHSLDTIKTNVAEALDRQLYQGTSVTDADVVADIITLVRTGDLVKIQRYALYFGPNDDRIATVTSYPDASGYFWCMITLHGYEAHKRLHVCQIEVLNPFQ